MSAAPARVRVRQAPPLVAVRPRAGEVLERLAARGGDVTELHLAAAVRLRAAWAVGGGAAADVQGALRAVGPALAPLLLWVCVYDRTVKEWAALPRNVGADAPKEVGKLLAALAWLADHYQVADPAPPG